MSSRPLEIFRDESILVDASPVGELRLRQAVRRFQILLASMLVIWLGCELAAWGGLMPSAVGLALAGANPFWAGGFFGIALLYFWSRPTAREFRWMAGGGLLLSLVLYLVGRRGGWESPASQGLNLGIGIAAALALLARAARTRGLVRTEALALCLPAFLTMSSTFILAVFFRLSPLRRETLDGVVYAAEQTLGMQPSFLMGQLFQALPPLAKVSEVVYLNAAVPFLCVLGMQVRSRRPPPMDVYTIFVAIAVVFSAICISFPVVGPVFAFGPQFPNNPPAVAELLSSPLPVPDAPRNCMPSGHTAWALLVWWQARPFGRWVRLLGLGNLIVTVLATLGFGLHYWLDLVVAVPAAVALQAICTPGHVSRKRWEAVASGVSLTVLWLVVIRWGRSLLDYSVILTNLAALTTVAFPLLQERRLYAALQKREVMMLDDLPDRLPLPTVGADVLPEAVKAATG